MNKNTIKKLEEKLLDPNIRRNAKEIQKYVAADLIEYCASGQIYKYKPGDIWPRSKEIKYKIKKFIIKELSNKIALALYTVKKKDGKKITNSLRSSIWKNINGKWKIIFHQGTQI